MSRSTVVIELAGDAPLPPDLAAGGVFVPDCGLRLAEECDLVVRGATHQLQIVARVVYVDPRGGAGLELLGFSSDMKAQLAEIATASELPAQGFDDDAAAFEDDAPQAAPPDGDGDGDGDGDDYGLYDDDLEVPGSTGTHDAVVLGFDDGDSDDDDDDDLAIPVADEDEYVAAPAPTPAPAPSAPSGEAVFAYTKPGLAYRGGVARAGTARPVEDEEEARDELGFTEALASELDAELGIGDFADADDVPEQLDAPEVVAVQGLELDLIDPGTGDALASAGDGRADAGDENDYEDGDAADGEAEGDASAGGRGATGSRRRFALNVNERLRGLSLAAQVKMATQGELHERIILERLYGKNVWETLLRNPRLTAPEVSRIARYGSLPRVLLEIIVGNNAWLQIPEVRRALLSNPRLGVDQVVKVLRLTPKHELKLAAIQTAYPHAVRNAAKMLMRGES